MTYHDHTISQAWGGHWNVTRDGGFCGGYPSIAAAKAAIDSARKIPPPTAVVWQHGAEWIAYAPDGSKAGTFTTREQAQDAARATVNAS